MIAPRQPRIPFSAVLSITNHCNLSCPHCFARANECLEGELTTEQWCGVIDELFRSGVFQYTFSGGEPFAQRSWKVLVEYVTEKPGTLRFNTNATLIDEETAQYLRNTGRVRGFIVSLDGPDAETHDKFRGQGSFDAALRGIRALRSAGYHPQGFCTVTTNNIHKIEATLRLAKELELSRLTLTPITATGRGKRNLDHLLPSVEQIRGLLEELNASRSELNGVISGTLSNVAEMVARLRENGPSKEKPVMCIQHCGAASSSFSVRADGQLVPCEQASDYPCGSLLEHSLQELWWDSDPCRHVRGQWNTSLDEIEECKDCEWRRDCNGGCPASAHSSTGVWGTRDPLGCIRELI